MNERIKELMLESGFKIFGDKIVAADNGSSGNATICSQKFAGLLVLEMCNVLDKAQWDIGRDWICNDGTRIIPKVKEHFGLDS